MMEAFNTVLHTVFQVASVGLLAYGAILTGSTPRVFNALRERQIRQQGQTETL